MSQTFWQRENKAGDLVVLWFRREDMDSNVLSEVVLLELESHLLDLKDTCKGLVIASGNKNQFIAGADITEIEKLNTAELARLGAESLQQIFQKVADLPFPTVAAIHGACLGGGLELSLCCTWRIASDDAATQLGLPEIQLGLIPGAGGTQRLPRLVGLQTGLDMVLTGKRLDAKKSRKIGLVDEVVHKNILIEVALDYATKSKRQPLAKGIAQSALEDNPVGRSLMYKKAKEMVDKNTKGFYPAAYKALDTVFKGYELSLAQGLKIEAQMFGDLAASRQARSLIHLFHATTAIKKHPYKGETKKHLGDVSAASLIGVIGSGFMGAGIATVCANKNLRVRISDPNAEVITKAYKSYREYFRKLAKRKKIKDFEVPLKIARISPSLETTGMGQCDIVIEAVYENLELKQKILKDVESQAKDNLIFASNTSALPIHKIAENAKRKENVLGMHFFSPVEKMPLLEIVKTEQTAGWVIEKAFDLGQKMGKQVIIVNDGPGFYTTRALAFFLHEAALMLAEGAKTDKIDRALCDFGFPVGPITLIDEVGIDVGFHVLETMASAFPSRIGMPEGLKMILDSGRLGRKNAKGFYLYVEGKKTAPDPEVIAMLEPFRSKPKGIPQDEIADRCLLVFVNESVRCLEEGIIAHPHDGDVGAVFGLGFPPFWGGPFKYVDHIGVDTIYDRLSALADVYGERFQPAAMLKDMKANQQRFFPDEVSV
jgi:3-hydroxyacyl-CoA dehydrogenase / enoyl-CoA hydratase / 3-hydroxybutyryl-CoA epimerase